MKLLVLEPGGDKTYKEVTALWHTTSGFSHDRSRIFDHLDDYEEGEPGREIESHLLLRGDVVVMTFHGEDTTELWYNKLANRLIGGPSGFRGSPVYGSVAVCGWKGDGIGGRAIDVPEEVVGWAIAYALGWGD